MPEIHDFSQLDFKTWDDVSYQGKKISSFFGKIYFRYDEKEKKLLYKNFNIFERIIHTLFGYKKEFCRKNFWDYLKTKHIVEDNCPKKNIFRKVIGKKLSALHEKKETYFSAMSGFKEDSASEQDLIELFKNGLDVNVVSSEKV